MKIAIAAIIVMVLLAPQSMAQENRALWSQENFVQSAKIHYKYVYIKQGKLRKDLYHCIDLIHEATVKFGHKPQLYYMLGTFYAEINAIDTVVAYFDSTQMFCDDESINEKDRKHCYKGDKYIKKMEDLRLDTWEKSYNDGVEFLSQYDTVVAWQKAAPTEDSAKALDSIKLVAYNLSKDNFETALLVKPRNPRTYDGLAVLLEREQNHHDAIDLYMKAIDIMGETAPIVSKIAYAYIYIPEWQKAIEWFEKYSELEPEDVNALINLSVAYNNIGDFEKWYDYTVRVLELQPENTQFLFNAGQYWFMEMQNTADKMSEVTDSTPDAETIRAELETKIDECKANAVKYFENTIKIDHQDVDALKRLGILYLLHQENQKAATVLENFVAIDSTDNDVLDFLGRAYINMPDYKSAIRPYELMVANDPGNKDAWERLAELYPLNDMKDKAEEAAAKAEALKNL
jgi:tetratricopeptide (TPR) repeat protein